MTKALSLKSDTKRCRCQSCHLSTVSIEWITSRPRIPFPQLVTAAILPYRITMKIRINIEEASHRLDYRMHLINASYYLLSSIKNHIRFFIFPTLYSLKKHYSLLSRSIVIPIFPIIKKNKSILGEAMPTKLQFFTRSCLLTH